MPRQTKAEKLIDAAIERAYGKHAAGRMISVMKIPQVFKEARAAIVSAAGEMHAACGPEAKMTGEDIARTLDREMPAIVARYCDPTVAELNQRARDSGLTAANNYGAADTADDD